MRHIVRIHLEINKFDVHPDKITAILGIEPSRISIKGSRINTPAQVIPWSNIWTLSSSASSTDSDLEEHWKSFSKIVLKKQNIIKELLQKYAGNITVFAFAKEGERVPGIVIPNSMCLFVAEIGTYIDIDIYDNRISD